MDARVKAAHDVSLQSQTKIRSSVEKHPIRSHRQGCRRHRLEPRHWPLLGRTAGELGARVVISSRKLDACKEVADGIKKAGGDATSSPATSRAARKSRPDFGRNQTLRQDRHPGLQRRGQSLLRPAARIKDEAFDKINELQRQEQHLAVRAGDPANGRSAATARS